MKLFGSLFSPYVRRIRLLLQGKPYDFEVVDLLRKDRARFKEVTPVLKIPFLQDGKDYIYDSRVIFNYLAKKGFHAPLSVHEENLLTVIDGLVDSLAIKLVAKRSNVEIPPDSNMGKSHNERIKNSLEYLEKEIPKGSFKKWGYPAICLYCAIDWTLFRELEDLSPYKNLMAFKEAHLKTPGIPETDPRK